MFVAVTVDVKTGVVVVIPVSRPTKWRQFRLLTASAELTGNRYIKSGKPKHLHKLREGP
jgi:hypothetical protein